MITTDRKNIRKEDKKEPEPIRNYTNPEPLNTSHVGKSVTVTLINNRVESGRLTAIGAYMITIEFSNKKELIINKGAIITVSVL